MKDLLIIILASSVFLLFLGVCDLIGRTFHLNMVIVAVLLILLLLGIFFIVVWIAAYFADRKYEKLLIKRDDVKNKYPHSYSIIERDYKNSYDALSDVDERKFTRKIISITEDEWERTEIECLQKIEKERIANEQRQKANDIRKRYPDGYNVWSQGNKRANVNSLIVDSELDIADLDSKSKIAREYEQWEKEQLEYSNKCIELAKLHIPKYGRYKYDIEFFKKDERGKTIKGEFFVWEFFPTAYCMNKNLDYTNFPSYYTESLLVSDMKKKGMNSLLSSFMSGFSELQCGHVIDKDGKRINTLILLDKKKERETIIEYSSDLGDLSVKEVLKQQDELQVVCLESGKYMLCKKTNDTPILYRSSQHDIIANFLKAIQQFYNEDITVYCNVEKAGWSRDSVQDQLFPLCVKLPKRKIDMLSTLYFSPDCKMWKVKRRIVVFDFATNNDELKHFCEKIIKENESIRPLIAYITLSKEFDTEEMQKLIDAKTIEIKVKEDRKEREEKDKATLLFNVQSWKNNVHGVYYHYLLNYYPIKCDFEADEREWEDRWTVWNFKNTPGKISQIDHQMALDYVIPQLANVINTTFGKSSAQYLTLVCIPASSREKHEARYKDFSDRLCKETGMSNAYRYVNVIAEGEEKKKGGSGISIANLSFDESYFKGRLVILFDDVITKGESMERMKRKIESLGGIVVGAMFVGKTKHQRE